MPVTKIQLLTIHVSSITEGAAISGSGEAGVVSGMVGLMVLDFCDKLSCLLDRLRLRRRIVGVIRSIMDLMLRMGSVVILVTAISRRTNSRGARNSMAIGVHVGDIGSVLVVDKRYSTCVAAILRHAGVRRSTGCRLKNDRALSSSETGSNSSLCSPHGSRRGIGALRIVVAGHPEEKVSVISKREKNAKSSADLMMDKRGNLEWR